MTKAKVTEIILYILIVTMIFFILGNYKYQPSLSADELEAVETFNELKEAQSNFVEKNEYQSNSIDLSLYKVNSGYSDLLLVIQDLLGLNAVSGYFNEETREAIQQLQAENELELTAEIDDATFKTILKETLPLSAEELKNRADLVRLLQDELNLTVDGVLGAGTIDEIEQLKEELGSEEEILLDDTVLLYIIEQLYN